MEKVWRRGILSLQYNRWYGSNITNLSLRYLVHPRSAKLIISTPFISTISALIAMAINRKTALVTGGGAGIGYALTQHLLKKGYRVAIIDIDGARASAAQQTLGDDVLGLPCDVSSWESSAAAFKKVFEWAGRIDFLAANAGVAEKESLYTLPDEDEPQKPNLATVEVDLLGVFYGLKLYRHYVRKSGTGEGGKVVITSSMAGNYPMFVAPIYCAAKHGVSISRFRLVSAVYLLSVM
jgi:15-hydroxyprostaglandin dehydrogenase (NAD)